ncbi:MAG: nitrate reductase [Deltaproteobacteria bacterium]|nr:nitrate reductase [Deltaproteobacteria bacterium]MBW1736510.1 nitrate reductase [Deltaproteobacteria bacterium]MBW1907968.1 nitrate reductase [Deltaproteobacteria bacterium]MBW2034259.1 nitrate reductase [Deltaproteobacteria bacterium]MBW2114560.1 nitrate reductase [Deltaproteobacteria bacterium]
MDFYAFVEGPLLWIAFLTFIIGSLLRAALFFSFSLKKDKIIYQHFSLKYVLATYARWLFPFNKDVTKNPVFTILVYVFHICLIIVPIWFSAHIALWEESRFEWYWTAIPDALADWMTLIFLAIALFFLLRRIISADIRLLSTFSDYFLIVVVALPFLSGYFLSHGTVDSIGILGDNMELIHMLSGELMLILIPFTKLSHFVLFFFSRGATAIEFGRRGYTM